MGEVCATMYCMSICDMFELVCGCTSSGVRVNVHVYNMHIVPRQDHLLRSPNQCIAYRWRVGQVCYIIHRAS